MNKNINSFADKEILTDLLTSAKSLSMIYGTLVQEASNNDLLKKVKALSTEMGNEQRTIFNLIYSKGWYVLEAEDNSKINKALRKFSNQRKDIQW